MVNHYSMSETPNEIQLKLARDQKESGIPEGLWMRCPECGEMLFRKVVERAARVPELPAPLPHRRGPRSSNWWTAAASRSGTRMSSRSTR